MALLQVEGAINTLQYHSIKFPSCCTRQNKAGRVCESQPASKIMVPTMLGYKRTLSNRYEVSVRSLLSEA